MSAKRFTAGALLVLAIGTCDPTGDTTEPSTPPPPVTTTVPAGAESSSTTPSVTTSSPASTTPGPTTTTTVSPAAGAPVVTLAPLTPDEAEVVEALVRARTLAVEGDMDPDGPDLDERLDALFAGGGQQRETIEANRQYLRETGYRVRMNAEVPWGVTIERITFLDDPYVRAEVQVCYLDSTILYEPGGAPDGSDAIVNDDFVALRILYTLVVEDGTWQLFHGQNLSEPLVGEVECSAE